MKQKRTAFAVLVVVAVLAALIVVPLASADAPTDTTELRDAVTEDNISKHLKELQKIANRNHGHRASGSPGYDESAEYVYTLLDEAGYDVAYQYFTYDLWEEVSMPVLEQVAPTPTVYPPYDVAGFATMEYSGSDDVTAPVVLAANLGCAPSDFTGVDFTGKIALIERGVCYFSDKAINAQNAGAVGAIVFNDEARQDAFLGTLGGPGVTIPVVGSSYNVGQELAGVGVVVRLKVEAVMHEDVRTSNVIAETPGGRDDRVVVVGAHLDSVATAPGINDNGSGVAVILEIALQMAELGIEPVNKVQFAFWGAEESGLFGSEHYVTSLGKDIKDIALNLNFDMVASPNYVRFVYDGDGSDTGTRGTGGSGNIEDVFLDYFASQGLPTAPTELDGASDYQSFMDVGIPIGGLFTGAGGDEQHREPYDACYHTDCDDLKNINEQALDEMSDAAAHAVLTFAMTQSDASGTAKASGNAAEYKGPKAQK